MKVLLLALSAIFNFSLIYTSNIGLHYEPAIVEIEGIIEEQTFPGRPNYESIVDGDEIEKGWYLRLLSPVDILESKNDVPSAFSETERNVKIMHITFDRELTGTIQNVTELKKEYVCKGICFIDGRAIIIQEC